MNCNSNDVHPLGEWRHCSKALNAFAFFVFFAGQRLYLGEWPFPSLSMMRWDASGAHGIFRISRNPLDE